MVQPYFSPELFRFLKQLKKRNNREWFQANKDRYNTFVRDPYLRFIADFRPRLEKISPHYVADDRPFGGSLMRIYRDMRFSSEGGPYKPMAAAQFNHKAGKYVHAPGFYLHLEPGSSFAGVGLWHPDAPTQVRIREAIASNTNGWKKAISGSSFKKLWTFGGESLKRPPKQYDPDHPFIEDLKRRDFITATSFSDAEVCAGDFLGRFTKACTAAAPFMEFLVRALDLPWSASDKQVDHLVLKQKQLAAGRR
jgi:uncharacterized protein (TIGR02453 family)